MKARRRLIVTLAVAVALGGGLPLALPAAADIWLSGGDAAVVAGTGGDGLNLRAAPGLDGEIVLAMPETTSLEVVGGPLALDDGTAWYDIVALVDGDWLAGWVSAAYIEPAGFAEPVYQFATNDGPVFASSTMSPVDSSEAARGVPIAVWTGGEGLMVRGEPASWSEPLVAVPDGALVDVLSPNYIDDDGVAWSRVRYGEVIGYTLASGYETGYWPTAAASEAGQAIVDTALAYLGVPYVWGGMDPDGFDCSGYTWWVLSEDLGYDIGRPMEDQIATGIPVSRDELAPGDVIYFQNTYQWGVSHVGFYLGHGLFVSATGQYDSVGISSLYDPYWAARYLTARRVG
ncbi:MAG TPA: SH3 domain-containing C40 family peptidase [Thermomicrobiales bacterium]|nr:SH3 domain-containing C40 family peptidase [Thermomicrobiales bacterium]